MSTHDLMVGDPPGPEREACSEGAEWGERIRLGFSRNT